MIGLSDKGKYFFIKFLSFPILFSILLSLSFSMALGIASSYSSVSVKEEVSSAFAEAAQKSAAKKISVISTSIKIDDRSTYIELFNYARTEMLNSVDLETFSFFPGYFSNSGASESWYSSRSLFGSDEHISLLPAPINSIIDVDGHLQHEVWYLEMMFNANVVSNIDGLNATNFCYLPESAAKRLLERSGIDDPMRSDYESLLGTSIEIDFCENSNVQTYFWTVANIFLEEGWFDVYKNMFGNFLPCYLGLPSFSCPSIAVGFGHSAFACDSQLKNLLGLDDKFGEQALNLAPYDEMFIDNFDLSLLLDKYVSGGFDYKLVLMCYLLVIIVLTIIVTTLLRRLDLRFILWSGACAMILTCFISWIFVLSFSCFSSFSSGIMIFTSFPPFLIALLLLNIFKLFKPNKSVSFYDSFKI